MAKKTRKVQGQKVRRFADGGAIIGWDDNGPIYDYSQVSSVNSGLTPGDVGYVAPTSVYLGGDPTEPSNFYTPAPAAAPAPVAQVAPLPTNIATQQDAVAAYTGLLSSGYSDAEIRAAADQIYGKQSDADWAYLQSVSQPTSDVTYSNQNVGQAPSSVTPNYEDIVTQAYEGIGRSGEGSGVNQIDTSGKEYWIGELASGNISPEDFSQTFNQAVENYIAQYPSDAYSQAVVDYRNALASDSSADTSTVSASGATAANINALEQNANQNLVVSALGDSTTWGYNSGAQVSVNMVDAARDQLSKDLGYDVEFNNYGVNSTTLGDAINSGTFTNALNDNSSILLLNYGLNEAYRGEDPNQFQSNLEYAVQTALSSGKDVILQTPNYTEAINNVDRYAQIVRDVAEKFNITLDDKYSYTSPLYDTYNASDLVHPTEDIYKMLGTNLAGVIEKQVGAGGEKNAEQDVYETLVLGDQDATSDDVAYDYRGKEYDKNTLLTLASQIAPNIGSLQGGFYGEKEASAGFDYNEAKRILGQDPTAQEQVILDMARNLIDQGVTDLSQLEVRDITGDYRTQQVYDEFGQPTGQWQVNVPDPNNPGYTTTRILTPEEVAQITSERVQDLDYDEVRYTANDILSGRGLYSGEDLLTQVDDLTSPLTLGVGATYTGPGSTQYRLIANPTTGALQFNTVAQTSSDLGAIQAALTIASFIPGVQVFAQIANAAIALSQGNPLAAAASLAGAGGFSDAATALRVASALESGDVASIATSLMSNANISGNIGSTMLTDTVSLSDAVNAGRVVMALNDGNWSAAANAAAGLVDSPDAKTAAAAVAVVSAVASGNFNAIANATKLLSSTADATQKLNDPKVVQTVVNNAQGDEDPYSEDFGYSIFEKVINAGGTGEEALNASNIITGANNLSLTSTFDVDGKTLGEDFSNAPVVDGAEGTADATASAQTFGEAFRAARQELGPGKTFTWNGQQYSTNTREEDPALAAASDKVTGAAATGALSGGIDMPSADTSVDAAVKEIEGEPPASGPAAELEYITRTKQNIIGKLTDPLMNPAELSAADMSKRIEEFANATPEKREELLKGPYGSTYNVIDNALYAASLVQKDSPSYEPTTGDTITNQPTVLERINQQYKESGEAALKWLEENPNSPEARSVGTAYQAAGELSKNIGGGMALILNNKPLSDALVKQGSALEELGQSIGTGPEETKNYEDTVKLIDEAKGWQKLAVLGQRVLEGKSGLNRQAEIELRQELPALFIGGTSVRLALIASGVVDSADTAGNAALEEFDNSIKKGASYEDSLERARIAGAAAGGTELAIQLTLGRAAEALTDKLGSLPAKAATRFFGETVTEPIQEGGASAGVDYALGRPIDVNKALTQGVVALGTAGNTSTTTAGASTTLDAAQKQESAVTNINQTVAEAAGSTDVNALATAIDDAVNMGMEAGLDQKAVITTALGTAIVNGADINNAVDYVVGSSIAQDPLTVRTVASDVISAVNAVNGDVDAATTALQTSLEKSGIDPSTAADIVAEAKATADTTSFFPGETVGADQAVEGTTTINPETGEKTTISDTGGVQTTNVSGGGIDTKTVIDSNTGISTRTISDTNAGTTTQVVNDANAGTSTQTVTDNNTGQVTKTVIDSNTGVTTVTETNPTNNQTVTTVIDANSGITTQQSTNPTTGSTVQTTIDSNTGINNQSSVTGNVTSDTTTDTNNNTSTNVTTNPDINTQVTTTTNANTNVTTQVTVDSNANTQTTVTTNNNGQVVTESTIDNNNNTETTVQTDPTTNTSTTVVVDLNTNTVVDSWTDTDVDPKTVDPVTPVTEPTTETKTTTTTKPQVKLPAGGGQPSGILGGVAGGAGEIGRLAPQMLKSWVTGEKYIDPLSRVRESQKEMERDIMQQIDPRLASILQNRMGEQKQDLSGLGTIAGALSGLFSGSEKPSNDSYYSYGTEDSIDDILASAARNYAEGGYVEPLMAEGGMTLPLLAKRGGLPKMTGGREDFRDGKHVAGEGDGQSDDIPAMLADGEFVFPADVVSALGNGSSKAGTDKLYKMMHEIRARARSTGNKDLPPPALKSPLDYLKSKRVRSQK